MKRLVLSALIALGLALVVAVPAEAACSAGCSGRSASARQHKLLPNLRHAIGRILHRG